MSFQVSAWSIRNPIPVVCLFVALTLAGLVAFVQLPIKRMPNVSFPMVAVTVTQNGAAPSEIENQITRPVENALSGVSGVKHINSTVTLGTSSTQVEFELHSDMQKAMDDVRAAVERTRILLPPGIDPPTVQRFDIDSVPIVTYAVSSERMSGTQLSFFVDKVVARALQAQPGIAQVQRIGGAEREINVILDPDRMAALGVTASQINNAMVAFNTDDPGGRADVGGVEQTIRVLGSGRTVDDIRQITIPVAGRYVRLGDVAEVGDGEGEVRGFARLNGRPVTAVQINKTPNASEISAEDGITAAITKLQADHPDVHFTRVASTVDGTRRSYVATKHVLIEGIVLAVVVVWLFLRNWRATFIAAAAMPLSLIPTFVVMSALGFSLNTITLLALTLVIGILVDDAIVEIENIEKRVEAGESPFRAALLGADAIGLAVVATTFTIVAVFAPVSMMQGQVGQFFREFGLTVAVAVLFSLVVARLLTPLMAAYFLKPLPKGHQHSPRPLNPLYARVLNWALAHRWRSVAIGGGVFALAILVGTQLSIGFQPRGDLGVVYLEVQGPPGGTRDSMDRAVRTTTEILKRQADVETVFAQVGGSSGNADLRSGTITVVLRHDRSMSSERFKQYIAPILRGVPDVRVSNQSNFGQAPASVVLVGEDGAQLEKVQLELLRQMRGIRVIANPRPSPPASGPELIVIPRPAEAARLNVDSRSLAAAIRVATTGDIDANVAKYSEGESRLPIRVRLAENARNRLDTIAELRVPTLDGNTTPLSAIADIEFRAGPAKILRYNRERRVAVEADLAPDATLGQALAAINDLPVIRNLPPGVHLASQGEAEGLAELMTGFIIAVFSGVFLTFGVLVLLFKGFFKPVVIMAALPLCLLGAFAALWIFQMPIDLPAAIGLLMLLGLCAKNSILLVEFAIELERGGMAMTDALREACRERARPIIMTTVAMSAGMLPAALAIGEGAEFRQPMALAVIGGLMTSTMLSLILVPVVYEIVDDFERWITPKLGRLVTPRDPEDDALAKGPLA